MDLEVELAAFLEKVNAEWREDFTRLLLDANPRDQFLEHFNSCANCQQMFESILRRLDADWSGDLVTIFQNRNPTVSNGNASIDNRFDSKTAACCGRVGFYPA